MMEKKTKTQADKGFETESDLTKIRVININEIQFDDRNANQGTDLGNELLENSISAHGIGRGVLVDKNLKLIAGNHAVTKIKEQGYDSVIVVPTTGKTLVVTQRTDLDKDSKAGHELALADNRVGQANLSFDVEIIKELELEFNLDLAGMAINIHEPGPIFPGSEDEGDETDAAEQMETDNRSSGGDDDKANFTQNMFPIMAALSKAQRLEFDSLKKRLNCSTDTETIIQMMKLLQE